MATAPSIITSQKWRMADAMERKISRQIDELVRVSKLERDRQLGQGWIGDMRDFYNLIYSSTTLNPSYRPNVMLPETQFLALNETSDLTSQSPKIYITVDGHTDEERQKAFQANWRHMRYNNRIFEAVLWSQFASVGWVTIGLNPLARNGKGAIWLSSLDPDSVFPDPAGDNTYRWQYYVWEDWMYVDQVRRIWPEQGGRVRPHETLGEDYAEFGSRAGIGFQLPEDSSLSKGDDLDIDPVRHRDTRVRVRHCYILDNAKERVNEIFGSAARDDLVLAPETKWKYPNGRYIVECEGIRLADGPNYVPKLPEDEYGTFPITGIWSLPSLSGIWGPPPVRYSRSLQELSERMMTQTFENAVRLNNGITFIPQDSGIDIDAYGGMPAEVQMISSKDAVPIQLWPKEMPKHMTELPELLLQKVRQYQGFTPARQGQTPPGNVGADLFDATVFQSQALTRLRGRLYAESVQRIAQMVFYYMGTFKTVSDDFLLPDKSGFCTWNPIADPNQCQMYLDEDSLQSLSKAALQKLSIALVGKGLPLKFVLESFDIPSASQIAEDATREQELSALSRLKRPR